MNIKSDITLKTVSFRNPQFQNPNFRIRKILTDELVG